jgi:L-2-hydroxyglutarate oxidase LhgO
MSAPDFDAAIIGAGAVGLACAYALARRGRGVVVLESQALIGSGVSSRNSEVIHGGMHYPPGSLKARLCVAGRRALYGFLEAHNVAFDRCGKLIVAADESERAAIEELGARARANEVEGVSLIDGAHARALEPNLSCVAALLSEQSGVLDSHGYMLALRGEIEAHGGAVALETPFLGARAAGSNGLVVDAGGAAPASFTAGALIIAAGLSAQACAATIAGYPAARIPRLHYGKGSYFTLRGVKAPFQRLIYPPPVTGSVGLHYRRDLGGRAHFGPDLEYVAAPDYSVDPTHAAAFTRFARRFWPAMPDDALDPDYAGVRPKLHGPDAPRSDFVIDDPAAHGIAGLVCLFGIESPGLTASLAIGEEVVDRLEK